MKTTSTIPIHMNTAVKTLLLSPSLNQKTNQHGFKNYYQNTSDKNRDSHPYANSPRPERLNQKQTCLR